ncbi:probable alpha,alpha-trehalose-phosphate synthase [UDP-forming] 7 [Tanacetum coccineum]
MSIESSTRNECSSSSVNNWDLDEVVEHVGGWYLKSQSIRCWRLVQASFLVRFPCAILSIWSSHMSQGFNKIYNRSLGKALSGILKKHLLIFEDLGGDYNIELASIERSLNAVEYIKMSKGLVAEKIFTSMAENGKQADFVLCIGDDRSDV